jgi:ribosomal protein S18 acetylase RimI-like enzyme
MSNPQVNIRPATRLDYVPLSNLMNNVDQLHATHYPDRFKFPENEPFRSKEMIQALIEETESNIFVAEIDKLLTGFIVILISSTANFPLLVPRKFAVIDNIGVHPNFRNQGVGTALIETAQAWAKNKGAENIELNVYLFNTNAIYLYQKLGFKTIIYKMCKSME